jgi:hypothetical protein
MNLDLSPAQWPTQVIAGILVGAANESWLSVLIASLGFGCLTCIYLSIFSRNYISARATWLGAQRFLWLRPPRLAVYVVEFLSTATTCLLVASIMFGALLIFR